MKEAAGEANMTVITIVLIGLVAAIAVPLISSMLSSTAKQACCTGKGFQWKNGLCYNGAQQLGDADFWDATNKVCK